MILRRGAAHARRLAGRASALVTRTRDAARTAGIEYIEHTVPIRQDTSRTYGIRLTMRNTGPDVWHVGGPESTSFRLLVDDLLLARLALPHDVQPGDRVDLHHPFRADDAAGHHRVRVEIERHSANETDAPQPAPWIIDVETNDVAMSESTRLHEISRKHNPWYYNPLVGITESSDGHPFPLFIAEARGCRAIDVEGNEFIDYAMGWGSTILGHADERVQAAVRDRLNSGSVPPFPDPLEMEVSQTLVDSFPHNDMVVFGKNGSDVCTVASRLARVITKKKVILSCGFHGWQDFGLDYFSFENSGIPNRPKRVLHKFEFGDHDGFRALYERHKHELAAVMIEPAGALISDEVGLGGEADPEFLRMLQQSAHDVGALLIFDEIVTGFRYPGGSVQHATGVQADLTCLGKALASGMPLSALLGPYEYFAEYFHKVHFDPTFKGEVYSFAAAKAAIDIYRDEPVAEHIWRFGESLRTAVDGTCADLGIDGGFTGPPFRMSFIFRDDNDERRRLKRTLLFQELMKRRIITVSGMVLPSYAHDDRALDQTISAFAESLEVVVRADETRDLHSHIDLPPLS